MKDFCRNNGSVCSKCEEFAKNNAGKLLDKPFSFFPVVDQLRYADEQRIIEECKCVNAYYSIQLTVNNLVALKDAYKYADYICAETLDANELVDKITDKNIKSRVRAWLSSLSGRCTVLGNPVFQALAEFGKLIAETVGPQLYSFYVQLKSQSGQEVTTQDYLVMGLLAVVFGDVALSVAKGAVNIMKRATRVSVGLPSAGAVAGVSAVAVLALLDTFLIAGAFEQDVANALRYSPLWMELLVDRGDIDAYSFAGALNELAYYAEQAENACGSNACSSFFEQIAEKAREYASKIRVASSEEEAREYVKEFLSFHVYVSDSTQQAPSPQTPSVPQIPQVSSPAEVLTNAVVQAVRFIEGNPIVLVPLLLGGLYVGYRITKILDDFLDEDD
jgi:hypothetical protein